MTPTDDEPMKPGDPYYALYTREVLPDEINADPVDPAPDERDDCCQYARDSVAELDIVEAAVRCLPGETISGKVATVVRRVAELEAELKQHKDAAAAEAPHQDRLNAVVCEHGARAGMFRAEEAANIIERLVGDLATVTRERDELGLEASRAIAKAHDLTRELAEAKAQRETDEAAISDRDAVIEGLHDRIDELETELAEAQSKLVAQERDIAETRHQLSARTSDLMAMAARLAEAREELRLHEPMIGTARNVRWQIKGLDEAFSALDEHRAKTSVLPSANVDIPHGNPIVGPENKPDYETASRLTKGVRYRVVAHACSDKRAGNEFVAHGAESLKSPWWAPGETGWYDIELGPGLHRVVRVEPEKAPENKPRRVKLEPWDPLKDYSNGIHDGGGEPEKAASKCPQCRGLDGHHKLDCSFLEHDGGGERSGQVGSRVVGPCPVIEPAPRMTTLEEIARSGQVDDGPPRVGDVVRVDEYSQGSRLYGTPPGKTRTVTAWNPDFYGSSEEKAKGFGYLRSKEDPANIGCRVTILRRAGQPEAKAEAPMLGPHAATVADLARRLDRVEQMLILKDDCAYVDIAEEIRAERAGRKSDG